MHAQKVEVVGAGSGDADLGRRSGELIFRDFGVAVWQASPQDTTPARKYTVKVERRLSQEHLAEVIGCSLQRKLGLMSENVFSRDAFQRSTPLNREPKLEAEQFSTFAHGALALLLLIALIPLLLFVALAIAVEDGGPVMFAHRRLGRYGRSFDCLKFRTMAKDAEERLTRLLEVDPAAREEWERDRKLRKDPRITPLGSILRRSSLDELPQLINVLRGEMSLVGPRPIVQAEVARYGSRIRHYYSVKPGITGLWQVSGRSDVSYRTRVAMDCLYARNRSLLLDGWLLVLTVPAVLFRRGCY